MTIQIQDTCIFYGRKWNIESWDGNYAKIPSNEKLGINVAAQSSANWSGRIDHFIVYKSRLFLLKIEVNIDPSYQFIQPNNAMREVLIRYENRWKDIEGTKRVVQEHKYEYLVFHDLFIPYTGDLFLSYPVIDVWEQPNISFDDEKDNEDEEYQQLVFRRGILIDY